MAQLNVEPKKNNLWWLWLLLAIIGLVLLFSLLRGCNHDEATNTTMADSTTIKSADTANDDDDWSIIDRNAPQAIYDEVTDKDVTVRGNDNYAIYSIDETILFDSDKNTIKSDAEERLKQVASSVEKRFAGGQIRIYGYTDATGTATYNKELAEQRAETVKSWFERNADISADRLSVNPVGEAQPVASNETEKGREQNRRVEIVVRKK